MNEIAGPGKTDTRLGVTDPLPEEKEQVDFSSFPFFDSVVLVEGE